ncbi:hypothetical protein [Aquisalimonas sp.]|uniref:hypothetical protein n=1 Tax=Aquisalimonas sp. TaxID=1872621 RepID=UPI0025C20D24|nr:hypothetical protein [Aquisalimonas sp.]
MGDVQRRGAQLPQQPGQVVAHLLAQLRIEVGQGLVEQQHARLCGQGAGNGDPLLLAPREFAGIAFVHAAEVHQLQQLPRA